MRTEEDKRIVSLGNLWSEFKGTEFGRELYAFFDIQEKLAKDAAFERLISGDDEEARQAAQKLSGILAVKAHIEDSITAMKDLIDGEKAERKFLREIPSHVS